MPKSVFRAVLGRMQFTLRATRRRAHGASHLVQAMSAWLVKTRRAPSRHSRDARVYDLTTTARHKLGTPPSPLTLAVAISKAHCGYRMHLELNSPRPTPPFCCGRKMLCTIYQVNNRTWSLPGLKLALGNKHQSLSHPLNHPLNHSRGKRWPGHSLEVRLSFQTPPPQCYTDLRSISAARPRISSNLAFARCV